MTRQVSIPGRDHSMASVILEDGVTELSCYRLIFNDRVCVGRAGEGIYERAFCFPHGYAALAMADWDGQGDPPGPWLKEAGTSRARCAVCEQVYDQREPHACPPPAEGASASPTEGAIRGARQEGREGP